MLRTRPASRTSYNEPKGRQARILGIEENVTGYVISYEDTSIVSMSHDVHTATGLPIDTPLRVTLPTPERIIQAKRLLVPPTQVPTVAREPPVVID